jgi:ABC-type Fe3+/spermidine/putrescine transport system ATPase subunit
MLEIKNISKQLGDFAISNISFTVEKGEYFVLLGESGAGKSVLLEIIAGLEKADNGNIFLNDINLKNKSIHERNIGIVYQDFALFPHLTVFQNIAFPLKNKNLSKILINAKVEELAAEFEITHLLKRKPDTLSGGEKQRVALARCLAMQPDILLLDEPLAAVDVRLKDNLNALLRNINRKGITIIHVTHDFDEALSLASHIAIIDNGNLIACGKPHEIFNNPAHPFIARFAGIRNFFDARLSFVNQCNVADIYLNSGIKISLASDSDAGAGFYILPSDEITISLDKSLSSASNCFQGVVKDMIPTLKGIDVMVDCGDVFHVSITQSSLEKLHLDIGTTVWISWKAMNGKFIFVG